MIKSNKINYIQPAPSPVYMRCWPIFTCTGASYINYIQPAPNPLYMRYRPVFTCTRASFHFLFAGNQSEIHPDTSRVRRYEPGRTSLGGHEEAPRQRNP